MNFIIKLILFSAVMLNASSLDSLLKEYSQKTDLSSKTKLENSGHLFVYTKNDISSMQAKNLSDILKSIPDFTYEESRFGYADIYNSEAVSFQTHTMRLYLDNQELISGMYGSGIPLYSNISLDFIDHIEVYLGSPSYRFTTESSLLVVKLYTKTGHRDQGTKFKLFGANDGYKQTSINHIDYYKDFTYQLFVDFKDNKQDKISHKNSKLSKDKKMPHLFTKFEKDDLKLNFQLLNEKSDAFINLSSDATPLDSSIDTTIYNINIEKMVLNDNLKLSLDHSIIDTILDFKDDNALNAHISSGTFKTFYQDTKENITTLKAVYEKEINDHNIFAGYDIRRKDIDFNSLKYDNVSSSKEYDGQTVQSLYFEDEYKIDNNKLFTFSAKYSLSNNANNIKDQEAKNYRIGYIHLKNNFTFKTYYSNSDMLNEPYLYTSTYANTNLKNMSVKLLSHETSYETKNSKTSIKLGKSELIDALAYDYTNKLIVNVPVTMDFNYAVFSHDFHILDFKNFFSYFYSYRDNIPTIGKNDYRGGELRTIFTKDKSTFFSEIIYRQNDETKKDFYDLSLGWKYKVKKGFNIGLKGENILDKSYSTAYYVPNKLLVNNTPKRFLFEVEYIF